MQHSVSFYMVLFFRNSFRFLLQIRKTQTHRSIDRQGEDDTAPLPKKVSKCVPRLSTALKGTLTQVSMRGRKSASTQSQRGG